MAEAKSSNKVKIAIDAMGGDFAPANVVKGAFQFLNENKESNLEIVFVGNRQKIEAEITQFPDTKSLDFDIKNAEQVIFMDDDSTAALKSKKNSSMAVGLDMHSAGEVDAFVSAGNTGAMLSASTLKLGRIKGVSRPTIGSFFPTLKNNPTLLLDVGANSEVKPKYLQEFAIMGSVYLSEMYDIKKPTVALLNIGEEEKKGNEIVKEAYQILKKTDLNFIGNVEGRDIFPGKADIVICDGFTGNIILKFAESFIGFFKETLKRYADESVMKKLKVAAMAPTIKDVFKEFDYQEHGGVPMLGVNGVVIIGHGSSTPKAFKNMLNTALTSISKKINQKIEKSVQS